MNSAPAVLSISCSTSYNLSGNVQLAPAKAFSLYFLSSHKRTHELFSLVVPHALDSSCLFILFIFHRQNSSCSVYAIDLILQITLLIEERCAITSFKQSQWFSQQAKNSHSLALKMDQKHHLSGSEYHRSFEVGSFDLVPHVLRPCVGSFRPLGRVQQ